MQTTTRRFRTVQYGDSFTFEFRQQQDGQIDIYSIDRPPCAHDPTPSRTHLDASGKVDVAEATAPRTFDRALILAVVWAEGYSHYCRTGMFTVASRKYSVQQPADR